MTVELRSVDDELAGQGCIGLWLWTKAGQDCSPVYSWTPPGPPSRGAGLAVGAAIILRRHAGPLLECAMKGAAVGETQQL